jgi:hypothetical protein
MEIKACLMWRHVDLQFGLYFESMAEAGRPGSHTDCRVSATSRRSGDAVDRSFFFRLLVVSARIPDLGSWPMPPALRFEGIARDGYGSIRPLNVHEPSWRSRYPLSWAKQIWGQQFYAFTCSPRRVRTRGLYILARNNAARLPAHCARRRFRRATPSASLNN